MKNLAQEARRRRADAIAAIDRLDRNIFETSVVSTRPSAGAMTLTNRRASFADLSQSRAA